MSEKEPNKNNRRRFIGGLAALLGSGAAATGGPQLFEAAENTLNAEELIRRVEELETTLSARYGIEISARGTPVDPDAPGRPLSDTIADNLVETSLYRAYRGLENLKSALGLYPPSFIRQQFRRIALSSNIRPRMSVDEDLEYFAVTSFTGEMLMKTADDFWASHKAVFGSLIVPEFVHHEFAHRITQGISEEVWTGLHPGIQYLGDEWKEIREAPVGFADPYGTLDFVEDIGTVAELLFARPSRVPQIKQRLQRDSILARKVQFLMDWYETQSNGLMNVAYWEAVERGEISESYWDER